MINWIDAPVFDRVDRLTEVPLVERQAILAGDKDDATHRQLFDRLPALRQVEIGGAAARRDAIEGSARVACWNVERLRHIDAIEATLRAAKVDLALLSEVDRGMARSGNGDRIVELAARFGAGYAYAIEYLELDLGDADEKRIHSGEVNQVGFHGAALVSDVKLSRPFLIRQEARGEWFDGTRDEPRVGGTVAVGATVNIAGTAVIMVSVHLESHCTPAVRRDDTVPLLTLIDEMAPSAPVILGGDFNTSTASRAERDDRPAWLARLAAEPDRLICPERHEMLLALEPQLHRVALDHLVDRDVPADIAQPVFALLAEHGYDRHACNVAEVPTTRHADPNRPRAKIDWFFTRGLIASDPQILPALRPDGTPSSDHDCLVVTVRPT